MPLSFCIGALMRIFGVGGVLWCRCFCVHRRIDASFWGWRCFVMPFFGCIVFDAGGVLCVLVQDEQQTRRATDERHAGTRPREQRIAGTHHRHNMPCERSSNRCKRGQLRTFVKLGMVPTWRVANRQALTQRKHQPFDRPTHARPAAYPRATRSKGGREGAASWNWSAALSASHALLP